MNPNDSFRRRGSRGFDPIAALLSGVLGAGLPGGRRPTGIPSPFDLLFGGGPGPSGSPFDLLGSLLGGAVKVEHIEAGGVFTTLQDLLEQARKDEDNLTARIAETRIGATIALLESAQEFASLKKGTFQTVIDAAPDSIEAEIATVLKQAHANVRHLLEKLFESYRAEAKAKAEEAEAQRQREEQEAEEQQRDREAQQLEDQAAALRERADQVRAGNPTGAPLALKNGGNGDGSMPDAGGDRSEACATGTCGHGGHDEQG